MRIDTGEYTGVDGGAKVISLVNSVGDCSATDTILLVGPVGAGGAGIRFTTNTYDTGYSHYLWGSTGQANTNGIDTLTTQAFTVNGTLNANGVEYSYLVCQYDGVTRDITTINYTGNGLDDQQGLFVCPGMTPNAALTKRELTIVGCCKTDDEADDTVPFTSGGGLPNTLQAFGNGYVELGTTLAANANGSLYNAVALAEVAGYVDFREYLGNGAERSITIGFGPTFVFIPHDISDDINGRQTTSSGSFRFQDAAVQAQGILSLDADGFTVGTDNEVNAAAGNEYYPWSFKDCAGGGAPPPSGNPHYYNQLQ